MLNAESFLKYVVGYILKVFYLPASFILARLHITLVYAELSGGFVFF
jgi:hypothetical protein